jgi:hypothetical protein
MTALTIFAVWCVVSIPAALIGGRALARLHDGGRDE